MFTMFGLSLKLRSKFFNYLEPAVFPDGHYILTKGNEDGDFYIITSGKVKCFTDDENNWYDNINFVFIFYY